MILTIDTIRNMGFRLDAGVTDGSIALAIKEAEQWFAVRYFGYENYNTLVSLPASDPRIAGGLYRSAAGDDRYIAGYVMAAAYIAFAALLRQNINATPFGSVRKRDEYSENVDIWDNAKYYDTIGRGWFRELADAMGWRPNELVGYYTESAEL